MASRRSRSFISYALLTIIAVVVIIPIAWMLLGSMETMSEMFSQALVPAQLSLANYVTAFTSQPLLHYFFNSFVTTGAIVLCQLITSALAAYGIVFTAVRGRYVVFGLGVALLEGRFSHHVLEISLVILRIVVLAPDTP